jgi:hypothetical protein
MVVRTGAAALERSLPAALADESSELSGEMRELLSEMSQMAADPRATHRLPRFERTASKPAN